MSDIFTRVQQDLLELSAELAAYRDVVIAGEGNVSAVLDDDTFLVKASGTSLSTLRSEHLVQVAFEPLLEAMETGDPLADTEIESLLLGARVDSDALKPSVESLFHAWLLKLDGVGFVSHAHPVAANALLCSPRADDYASRRLFPDQVVYCGPESVLVPYVDPGLVLARHIARAVDAYSQRAGILPKIILLENHGVISLGGSAVEAGAAMKMAEKSARVFIDAAALGGPVYMSPQDIARIDGRIDEKYRQQILRRGR